MNVKTACIGGLAPSMSSNDLGLPALLHRAIFLLELGHVDAALQHELELVHVHGLAEEIVGARRRPRAGRSACRPGPRR